MDSSLVGRHGREAGKSGERESARAVRGCVAAVAGPVAAELVRVERAEFRDDLRLTEGEPSVRGPLNRNRVGR